MRKILVPEDLIPEFGGFIDHAGARRTELAEELLGEQSAGLGGPLAALYDGRMRIVTLPTSEISAHASHGVMMEFLLQVIEAHRTHVHIARLAAGGSLGELPAPVHQAFAVLSGVGEVSVDGGLRRRITAGQAAIWEPGEVHQSWALTDLVAVIVETSGALDLDKHVAAVDSSE